MPGVNDMVAAAERSLGLVDTPNYITNWYVGRNGAIFARAPWCDMSITYWAYHSGNYQAVNFDQDFAYTVYHAQRFQRSGRWNVDVAGIRRGDILFFDWDLSNNIGNIDHVGIVTAVVGRDIHTVEANTENSCARRVRRADTVVGYGRPAYVNSPMPAPVPVPINPVHRWFFFPTLKQGDKDKGRASQFPQIAAPVATLQNALNIIYNRESPKMLIPDGDFGLATNHVVYDFQRFAKLIADGVVGPRTWNAIAYFMALKGR
jgi:hypothetical protein